MRREHPPLAEASLPEIRNVLRAAQPPKRGGQQTIELLHSDIAVPSVTPHDRPCEKGVGMLRPFGQAQGRQSSARTVDERYFGYGSFHTV